MNRYNYGTGARKYEEIHIERPRKVQKKAKKLNKTFLFGFIVAVALAFTLLGRYSMITEKTAQIEKLKDTYETVNSQVISKEFELEKSIDLKKVEETATTKLNMQRPEKHQLVYINMNNCDYCEVNGGVKAGFLASIKSGFMRIVEYFG